MDKKNKRYIINVGIFFLVIFLAFYFHNTKIYTFSKSALVMDTFIEIEIETKDKDGAKLIDESINLIEKYEKKFDFYNEDSEISKINELTNSEIDEEIFEILKMSEEIYNQTGFLYDVSVGKLSKLWDFDNQVIPTEDQLEQTLRQVGFDKVSYTKKNITKPKELELNFGSIAKGFIIDKVIELLRANNVETAIINAGGDIRIIGKKKPLLIGIQHPRAERGELFGKISIANNAIVTSGDYERYFEIDGIRYHHILNPQTGYPANENISVTVIAENAMLADAYSTAFFVMEHDKAVELADRIDGVEVMMVTEINGKLEKIFSNNMKRYIEEE
ncbi:MAG: FAD:protein FMN transferase [Candidatus Cloacimonetes bacterium]|nr:FAD:protein FMN transferase [Candidatus Cloacimonadota bacterium]